MSDTLQEQEDAILTTIRNSDDAQRNAVTTADYCDECKGRPHAPWCSLQRRCQHGLPVNDVCNECIEQAEFEASISEYQPAARGGGGWHADESSGWGYVWQGAACLAKCPEPSRAQQIITEHNQHQALVAERERLRDALGEMLNRFYPHTCNRGPLCAKCGALRAAQSVFNETDYEQRSTSE